MHVAPKLKELYVKRGIAKVLRLTRTHRREANVLYSHETKIRRHMNQDRSQELEMGGAKLLGEGSGGLGF